MIILLAVLAAAGHLVYKVIQFLTSPGALQSILEFFKAVLMCAGLGLLFLVLFGLWARFAPQPRLKLKRIGREYAVRCHAYEMEAFPVGYISPELAEVTGQEPVEPVYLQAVVTNLGLRISPFSAVSASTLLPEENAEGYLSLSGGRSQAVIIGVGSFQLFYLTYHQEGSLTWEQTPTGQAGHSGPLSVIGNDQGVKIVIIFNAITLESNLDQVIPRERPLKLKIEGVDPNGQVDTKATHNLYAGLLKLVNSMAPEDDDSWMYHSRPIYW